MRLQRCRKVVTPISNTDIICAITVFLYEGPEGWRLSPAYDLNAVPTDINLRILTTAMDVAGYFKLDDEKARDLGHGSGAPFPSGAQRLRGTASRGQRSTLWHPLLISGS